MTDGEIALNAIAGARAALRTAEREAHRAWQAYAVIAQAHKYKYTYSAARARGASQLPEDIRKLLNIDNYGSKLL